MGRVVIVHDYLSQRGGAERVVLALLHAFPGSRVVTSVYAPELTFPEFARHEVETILPGWLPLVRRDPRVAFTLLPGAFRRHRVDDADLVICSSSGWAHGITSKAPKLVYCHTPARWIYALDDYLIGQPLPVRLVAHASRQRLQRWDVSAAASVATYVANSTVVRERIRRAYGRDAEVLHPPAAIGTGGLQETVDVPDEGFLLTVARDRGYKNGSVAELAAAKTGVPLVVVGSATTDARTTHAVGRVSDQQLRWLYANCRALVAASYEDFGLTPVEAMSFGKPVIALRAGGYLDSVVEGETGIFFDQPTVDSLAAAIERLVTTRFDHDAIRRHSGVFAPAKFEERMRELAEALIAMPIEDLSDWLC